MRINSFTKTLVGLSTLWATIYPLFFMVVWFSMFTAIAAPQTNPSSPGLPPAFEFLFGAIFPLHCITIIVELALLVFYIVHIIKNTALSDTPRIIAVLGLFLLPYFFMPVYYLIYVRRDTSDSEE